MATVSRVIAADPTSTALLVASLTGVLPPREGPLFLARFTVSGYPARLILADGGGTRATLTVAGPRWCAAAFLASLADAAEARADAA